MAGQFLFLFIIYFTVGLFFAGVVLQGHAAEMRRDLKTRPLDLLLAVVALVVLWPLFGLLNLLLLLPEFVRSRGRKVNPVQKLLAWVAGYIALAVAGNYLGAPDAFMSFAAWLAL